MIRLVRLPWGALALACLMAPAAVLAAPKTASGGGQATILKPFSLVKKADLNFGGLIPAGAGTAVINPVTGAMSTTGAITRAGTGMQPATFTTTGSRNSNVVIKVPNGTVTLNRVGGGATMTVGSWTLDGATNRKIPASQTFDFKVGGTLNIAAGQLEGVYTGLFTVTVNHP
jgi:hypothetical protein